jgi:hypothetical protein
MEGSSPLRTVDDGHRPVVPGDGNQASDLGSERHDDAAAREFRVRYDVAAALGELPRSAGRRPDPRRRRKGAVSSPILGTMSQFLKIYSLISVVRLEKMRDLDDIGKIGRS